MKRDKVYKSGASFRTALEDRLNKIAMEEGVDLQRIRLKLPSMTGTAMTMKKQETFEAWNRRLLLIVSDLHSVEQSGT